MVPVLGGALINAAHMTGSMMRNTTYYRMQYDMDRLF